jgi:hypothetical protein
MATSDSKNSPQDESTTMVPGVVPGTVVPAQMPKAEPSKQEQQMVAGEPITDDADNRYPPGLGPDPWANPTSVAHDAAEAEKSEAEAQSKSTSKSSKGGES